MRMNIEIDDALIRQVMENGNYPTKKAAVEAALQTLEREYLQTANAQQCKQEAMGRLTPTDS